MGHTVSELYNMSPYRGMDAEETVAITVRVPRQQHEHLRRTCLGHGDIAGMLAFAYAKLCQRFKEENLTTEYNNEHRARAKEIASGIRFGWVDECGPHPVQQGGTAGTGPDIRSGPLFTTCGDEG